ncbi:MAG: hypothetical protein EOP56_14770 [Sphingobacteriales bacterium]|nr:MAG: hypothetical protein EOP56_14770 [Sphingobacteriales bacterium]
MNFNLSKKILLLIFSTLSFSNVFASDRVLWLLFPPWVQRESWSWGTISSSAVYKGQLKNIAGETTADNYEQNLKSKGGFTYGVGTYFPVKRLGKVSTLAIGVQANTNLFIWDNLKGGIFDEDGFNFGGATIEGGLPITADFMFGCDALTKKNPKFSLTVGGGVMPLYAMTAVEDNMGMQFTARPVVKAEAGMFLGVLMKVRLMCAIGNIKYINSKNSFMDMGDGVQSNFTLTGKSSVSVQFVILPFSFMWEKAGWWNDTY